MSSWSPQELLSIFECREGRIDSSGRRLWRRFPEQIQEILEPHLNSRLRTFFQHEPSLHRLLSLPCVAFLINYDKNFNVMVFFFFFLFTVFLMLTFYFFILTCRYKSSQKEVNWSKLKKPVYLSNRGSRFSDWSATWAGYLISKVSLTPSSQGYALKDKENTSNTFAQL